MATTQITVTAAVAVAGYDLMTNEKAAKEPFDRVLRGVGVMGSAAAGDMNAELFVNGVRMGKFYNLGTGWPNKDSILEQAIPVPANAGIEFKMGTAPTTNPVNVVMEFLP